MQQPQQQQQRHFDSGVDVNEEREGGAPPTTVEAGDGRRRLALKKKLRLCSFPLASLALHSAQGSTVGDWRSLQRNSGRRWVVRCPSLPPSLRPSSYRREKKTPKRVFRHQRGKEEAPKVPSCSPREGGEAAAAAAAATTTLGGAVVVVSAQECEDHRAEREREASSASF